MQTNEMNNLCFLLSAIINAIFISATDVDAPQNLAASNIQTESAMLTWQPPRADISGYILSFESADGIVRVSGLDQFFFFGFFMPH